ncbi:hypothetical protein ACFDAU_10860 [Sulfuriferula sp. GW1]|uniref:hypothetical protein n=1 Tax=Sulfuriferula sp. GW1 TaxID=3345111 RepID=UPI0039AEF236
MTDRFELSKLDAARRQLTVAIRLLFDGVDPVAVHTLVGAASIIISDLVDQLHPDKSWDKFAQDANGISAPEYFNVMRKPQNFLKHARTDASETFQFDPIETESVVFWTVMNSGNFGPLSVEESVFQLWFLACHAPTLERSIEPYQVAVELFGDIRGLPRAARLAEGKRVLAEALANVG